MSTGRRRGAPRADFVLARAFDFAFAPVFRFAGRFVALLGVAFDFDFDFDFDFAGDFRLERTPSRECRMIVFRFGLELFFRERPAAFFMVSPSGAHRSAVRASPALQVVA
jgi:hypothetical protein